MPVIVPVAYGVGLLCLPLATLIAPPAAVARRINGLSILLLWSGLTFLALAAAQHAQEHQYRGLACGCAGLASLWLMVWFADLRNRRKDDDDDGSEGGGGGPGTPRQPLTPDAPGGTSLDWDDFDAQRATWGPAHPAERDRPLTPA